MNGGTICVFSRSLSVLRYIQGRIVIDLLRQQSVSLFLSF